MGTKNTYSNLTQQPKEELKSVRKALKEEYIKLHRKKMLKSIKRPS